MPNYLNNISSIKPPKLDLAGLSSMMPNKLNKIDFSTMLKSQSPNTPGISNILGSIGGSVSNFLDIIPSADKVKNENDNISGNLRGMTNKALMSGALGPGGLVAGTVNTLIDKTGGYADASKGAGKTNDRLNMIASIALPGAGWFAKKTDKFSIDKDMAGSSGFTGSTADAQKVKRNANAKLLFGRNKVNADIRDAKTIQNTASNVLSFNKQVLQGKASNENDIIKRNTYLNNGGWRQGTVTMGRKGLKFKNISDAKRIAKKQPKKDRTLDELIDYANKSDANFVKRLNEDSIRTIKTGDGGVMSHLLGYAEVDGKTVVFPKVQELNGELKYIEDWRDALDSAIQNKDTLEMNPREAELFTTKYKTKYKGFNINKFKNGGSMSVIPSGALHARKHNLKDVDEKLAEQITAKGVPVVTMGKGGEVEQKLEIERGEIVFRKSVTEKLEKLWKDGSEESMIKAGKLITDEIMNNTDDKSKEYEIEDKE